MRNFAPSNKEGIHLNKGNFLSKKGEYLIIMLKIKLLFFLFLVYELLLAQDAGSQQLIDNAAIEFMKVAGSQSALYSGNQQDLHPSTTNHPYLEEALFTKARLSYNGVIYPEIMIRLDLYRDELIIASPDFRNIVLFPENVDFAELHGRRVIYFLHDSVQGSPSTGYYYLLHSGNCTILEKQTAMLAFGFSQQYYSLSTKFYLYHDGIYYTIRNKMGLLKVLKPHNKELKRFISAHRWRFRRHAEELIINTVIEYEKISGSR